MQSRYLAMIILCLLASHCTEGQILDKLKKVVGRKSENTNSGKTGETANNNSGKTSGDAAGEKKNINYTVENKAKAINNEAKRGFYHSDVVVKTFDKEKQAYTTSYFDAGEIAMRSNWKNAETGEPEELFIDSEGYYISFNKTTQAYEKSNMLSNGVMSMMAPSMMAEAYKLPTGIIWEASEELKKKGLNFNTFTYVDFVFILKPEHFRDEMYAQSYSEVKTNCRGDSGCIKFNIIAEGYSNSHILFDSQKRLAEINVTMNDQTTTGSGGGKLEFFYESCEVMLPKAKEIKSPMQDLFKMGLDPSKN